MEGLRVAKVSPQGVYSREVTYSDLGFRRIFQKEVGMDNRVRKPDWDMLLWARTWLLGVGGGLDRPDTGAMSAHF